MVKTAKKMFRTECHDRFQKRMFHFLPLDKFAINILDHYVGFFFNLKYFVKTIHHYLLLYIFKFNLKTTALYSQNLCVQIYLIMDTNNLHA